MKNGKPASVKKMKNQCLNSDIISTLPQNIIETILTLMPIRDALRTSILSKKWRYNWRSMPKLVFTDDMVKVPYKCGCGQLKKYKLVNAIFHVLLLHNGPTILEFNCAFSKLDMVSEFDQIISYLSRGNNVKELNFTIENGYYKLPDTFFSLQGLERIQLQNCDFAPPLTFNGLRWLKSMTLMTVEISFKRVQQFFSKCPLLEHIHLKGYHEGLSFPIGRSHFTFVDLLRRVPLIQTLDISKYYMEYLCAAGMPHKLPTSLVHLKYVSLDVCLMEENQISSVFCIVRSSPVLEKIIIRMYDIEDELPDEQTSNNFLDPQDLNLDHLEILEMEMFSNLPVEREFVKLVMACTNRAQ